MDSLINLLFGKEDGIVEKDLESHLIGRVENDILEAKMIRSLNFDHFFKPLIGFLNKIDGTGGVLVIGAKASQGKPIEEISGVSNDLVKGVEDRILDDILAFPTQRAAFRMNVVRVPLKSGNTVVLIEIHPSSSTYAYYSDSENESAIRKGYSTERMKVADFIKFVEGKRSPRVKMEILRGLNSKDQTMKDREKMAVTLHLNCLNEGNKVGRQALSVIDVYYDLKGGNKMPVFTVEGLLKEQNETIFSSLKYPEFVLLKRYVVFLNPLSAPLLYPALPLKLGSIKTPASTFDDNRTLLVHVVNYEETTSSEQEFIVQFQFSPGTTMMPSITVRNEKFSFY